MIYGRHILIIAGETSADFHGANLVRAMAGRDSTLRFCGIGGERLKAEGVRILVPAQELSVVGITEVVSKIPRVLSAVSKVKKALDELRPDLVVLIDFPDFNLHIARAAKKRGLQVLYYISPQVWAWRPGRVEKIRRYVDHMAVIFPFEQDYYRSRNISATFVGHPLLDYYLETCHSDGDRQEPASAIGMMPGSRKSEIEKNLPVMLAAAVRIKEDVPEAGFLVSAAPGIDKAWMREFIRPYLDTCSVELVSGPVKEIFEKSSLVLAASGTITLETAIFAVPMIIIYRISPVSYLLGKALVKVNHIGLANIIAGERVVPELVQNDASPGRIAREASDMLRHPERMNRIRQKLKSVRNRLGRPGAAQRTADIAFEMLGALYHANGRK